MSDFREQLFPYLPADRFSTFSCGHIVPPEQIITFAVGKGPSGKEMTFTFSTRKDETLVSSGRRARADAAVELTSLFPGEQVDELGNAIFNIASIVPRGIVVFTPSYAFLDQLHARWTKSGLLERMGKRKKVSLRLFPSALDVVRTCADKVCPRRSGSRKRVATSNRLFASIRWPTRERKRYA